MANKLTKITGELQIRTHTVSMNWVQRAAYLQMGIQKLAMILNKQAQTQGI